MADNVTLSTSVRQSLLSLQNTSELIARTQNRLAEGLKVASAIDDPVSFFSAKSLTDRASDFVEKKDKIDQGISTITSALDGVEGIEDLVRQMKGVTNSMKSATDNQMSELAQQFNDLKVQIDNLTGDAVYQGTNLINGTGSTLSVDFSEQTASKLTVESVDLRAGDAGGTSGTGGLGISDAAYYTADKNATFLAITAQAGDATAGAVDNRYLTTAEDLTLTWQAGSRTFAAGDTIAFTYGTGSALNLRVATAAALTINQSDAIHVDVVTAVDQIATTATFGLVATGYTNLVVEHGAEVISGGSTDTINFTYHGYDTITLTTADADLVLGTGGTAGAFTLNIQASQSLTLTAGKAFSLLIYSDATAGSANASGAYIVHTGAQVGTGMDVTATTAGIAGIEGVWLAQSQITGGNIYKAGVVSAGDTNEINLMVAELDAALITLRTKSQTLGTNVALLNTRLGFTESYVNTLQGGSDKLVLADVNEEGANLLALQTRQQLGLQALSLAAQSEASILRLFA